MIAFKAIKLKEDIIFKKLDGLYSSKEELEKDLNKLGELALEENNFFLARKTYEELNDKEKVREVGKLCIKRNSLYEASLAFGFLKDKNKLLEILQIMGNKGRKGFVETAIREYFGPSTLQRYQNKFHKWAKKKGYEHAVSFEIHEAANIAYNLAENYDLGIGNAKGGLFLAYAFENFGLKTKIVETHRKGKGATFKWVDDVVREDIENKKILVMDKDIISGRSCNKVLKEVQKFNPRQVDIAFYHGNTYSKTRHVPEGYSDFYTQESFDYKNMDKIVVRLEKLLT